MPSISAHVVVANLVVNDLNIDNYISFMQGAIYPDLIENGHIGFLDGYYLIPDVQLFHDTNFMYDEDFKKGYMVHLLLDKYFILDYAVNNIGVEAFQTGKIYDDYSKISHRLLTDFHVYVPKDLFNIPYDTKDRLVRRNKEFLYTDRGLEKPDVLNYKNFKEFLYESSFNIVNDIKQMERHR